MKKILFIGHLLLTFGLLMAQNTAPTDAKNYTQTQSCLDADCIKKAEVVQYYDGLGRAKQIINVKASPAQKDVVSHIEYDAYGRPTKSYLPVPQAGTQNGAIYENPLANATQPDIYGTEKIYAEKIIENAPLDRIKQSVNTGTAWANKPIAYNYSMNASTTEVKKYITTTSWVESRTNGVLSFSGYYPINTLRKTAVTDEDGNTVTEYKNGEGKTVLIRQNDGTQNVDTYYVYDEYGQLVYVIPPKAAVSTVIDATSLNSMCYQYRYDDFGRLVEKKAPGKGWQYFVYDKQDRLVLSQDALLGTIDNNFKKKGWLFVKYDRFGRVVYTGFFANTATRLTMQTAVNNMMAYPGNNEERSNTPFTLNGIDVYYSKNAFPTGSMTLLNVNYYDTYPPLPAGVEMPAYVFTPEQMVMPQDAQNSLISTKSLPTASYVKNIEDDNWTKDFIWYDMKGRVIGTHSVNHLGGYTKVESKLDFLGYPVNTNTFHVRKQGEVGVKVKERFISDPQHRLLKHFHQINDRPEELLTENSYNELSQLKNKKVGNNLQSIDYAYNIRGWLTDVNKDQMQVADLGGKLFSYKIKYNLKQGIDNPDPVLFPNRNVTAQYNGNITEVDWRAVETPGVNPSLTPKRYGYVYDKMNRLTAGYYQDPYNPYSKEHMEVLDYDLNGNISKLHRTSVAPDGSNTAALIDKLRYQYNGNQAISIVDDAHNLTGYVGIGREIHYDLNGNMTDMEDKGILSIKYNFLNLSNSLHMNRDNIEDIIVNTKYNANGAKLRKESVTTVTGFAGADITKTAVDYLDGFQYSKVEQSRTGSGGGGDVNTFSLKAMQPEAFSTVMKALPSIEASTPDLQFLSTAEGFYDYINNQYIYQYKDHLGNVRVSFARNSAGVLEITDANDYYPFGMNHLKTGNAYFGKGSYKNYKYNGQELQETGMYDYGARLYMADIGRFGALDPLIEETDQPYAYANNNPVNFIDYLGMKAIANPPDDSSAFPLDYKYTDSDGSWIKVVGGWKSLDVGGTSFVDNIVLKAPSSSSAPIMPISCGACFYNGGGMNIILPPQEGGRMSREEAIARLSEFRGPEPGGGGLIMMDSMWDVLGIVIANNIKPETQDQALGLAALAIILTKGRATPGIIKAEMAVEASSVRMASKLGSGLTKMCFVGGTLVATKDKTKKIEDIQEGDLVWSYNEETGKKELKKVVELSRNTSSSLVIVSVNGTEIICTPEHPFYVNGNWIEAKDLTKGMLLTTLEGKTSPVESVKFLDEKVKVYNFEVEGNHSYYVSDKGILVHNTCWKERLAKFMEYAANIDVKTLTSQEGTIKHLENVFTMLDKTRTDKRVLKFVADDMSNVEFVGKGVMKISQKNAGDATFVYPNGGFQIFQKGKIVINKIK